MHRAELQRQRTKVEVAGVASVSDALDLVNAG